MQPSEDGASRAITRLSVSLTSSPERHRGSQRSQHDVAVVVKIVMPSLDAGDFVVTVLLGITGRPGRSGEPAPGESTLGVVARLFAYSKLRNT